jgi:hypothetical protein
MRGDHAGLIKIRIEAECARRVRSSTMSMIEEMEGAQSRVYGRIRGQIWSDIGGGLYY